MAERERLVYYNRSKVDVVFDPSQNAPFEVKKTDSLWQLSVNRAFFESQGFSPDEINGVISLREEVLLRQTTVSSETDVAGLRKWQELVNEDEKATAFKSLFEQLAALESLEERNDARAKLARRYLSRFASRRIPAGDYVDQLFNSIINLGLGEKEPNVDAIVATVFNNLKKGEMVKDREVSTLDALLSPDLSAGAKASWFEERFLPRLQFLEHQDESRKKQEPPSQLPPKEDQGQYSPEAQRQEESQTPPRPQQVKDEFEQHGGDKKRGSSQPIFIIDPAYTGYWEEDSYDRLDESSGKLIKSQQQRTRKEALASHDDFIDGSARTISGYYGDNSFALPLPPNFRLTGQGFEDLKRKQGTVWTDLEGHIFVSGAGTGLLSPPSFEVEIAMSAKPNNKGAFSVDSEISDQELPAEITEELSRINNLTTDSLSKIQEWADFIKNFFKFPDSREEEAMYGAIDDSSSRLKAMAEGKVLDCHLTREFLIAGLKRLDLPDVGWRAVNGYYIKSQEKDGTACIYSGTAHAWVKVRLGNTGNWMIIDATPPGDPCLTGLGTIEEFGQLVPLVISENDLAEMEREMKTFGQLGSPRTYDEYLLEFARQAGISKEEAEKILAVLTEIDKIKDREGRSILRLLREQFDRIIQEYTAVRLENMGLVEMSKGHGLEEPVDAFIDVNSGSLDPTGFAKRRRIEEKEEYYGGWDLEIIADGSGSMNGESGGRLKYLVQRDMSYLLHRALHGFSQEAQRRRLRLVTPLNIRSSQYMFRNNRIEVIKPLTDQFAPVQMAVLWKKSAENIGGGTPAHLGLQAVLDRIPPKELQLLKDKKLLKVVILISDGWYDDASRVNGLIRRLNEVNVIVAEFRITDARSLEDLPQNVAGRVIEAAKLLMPKRVRK